MTVYEMRTYTLHVGKMAEAVKLYTEFGYPALQKGGQDKKLIGYFQADTGRHGHDQSARSSVKVRRRRRSSRTLGVGLRQQGFRRGLRREVPSPPRVPGGQAPDRRPVGTAPLIETTSSAS
jgi:NIPSNAP